MKCNVGNADRLIRAAAGVILVALGIHYESWWGLIGIIPLLTAALAWCPAYIPFNISTCREKDGKIDAR